MTIFEKLKENFKILFQEKFIIFKKTKIVNGKKIINVEKDLSPEVAQRISKKTSQMFDEFGKDMDAMFNKMNEQMNEIFREITEA